MNPPYKALLLTVLALTFAVPGYGTQASVEDDLISIPLGYLEAEKNAAWEAIEADQWSDAVSHLEVPAKAGLRQSQFLYGLAIAFLRPTARPTITRG